MRASPTNCALSIFCAASARSSRISFVSRICPEASLSAIPSCSKTFFPRPEPIAPAIATRELSASNDDVKPSAVPPARITASRHAPISSMFCPTEAENFPSASAPLSQSLNSFPAAKAPASGAAKLLIMLVILPMPPVTVFSASVMPFCTPFGSSPSVITSASITVAIATPPYMSLVGI